MVEPAHFLNHVNLFGSPKPLLTGSDNTGILTYDSVTTPPAAASTSDFARHQDLPNQLHGAARAHATSLSVSDQQRIDIEFRADDATQLNDAERLLAEDNSLSLARARAPLAVGDTPPPMNIVMLISGSRGDVRPFLRIGQRLARDGHRVRLATHAPFRQFVESSGLEFYPLGGDPREMIGYMVRTGGKLVPTRLDMLIDEAPKKRRMVGELINSTWGACTEPDPDTPDSSPFTADAVIANPPSFGHYHVAEKLGVPLHMIMTLPWSPTRTYPHPLANMDFTRRDATENALSYFLVDGLTYGGIADIIGKFRKRLNLPKIGFVRGTDYLNQEAIPFTYLWSPSLLPRPDDWGSHIDIANSIFFDQASEYQPPDELAAFLAAGDAPVYIGFGSIPVQDPVGVTRIVFDALAAAGRRGIVSSGWGGRGGIEVPEHALLINEWPHAGDRSPDACLRRAKRRCDTGRLRRLGFSAGDTDGVEALLHAQPGGPFNLSEREYQELGILSSRHLAGWTLEEQTLNAVNSWIAGLLHHRYNTYRQAGLDGIEPCARTGGEQEIAGQPTVGLLHNFFLPGDNFAGVAMRWYCMGSGLDASQTLIGLALRGDQPRLRITATVLKARDFRSTLRQTLADLQPAVSRHSSVPRATGTRQTVIDRRMVALMVVPFVTDPSFNQDHPESKRNGVSPEKPGWPLLIWMSGGSRSGRREAIASNRNSGDTSRFFARPNSSARVWGRDDHLHLSKGKILTQSFFMLTTCHPPSLAAFKYALSFSA